MNFNIQKLVAWSPDQTCDSRWAEWAQQPITPCELSDKPPLRAIDAMTRRRLTQWGAMSLQVACECMAEINASTPTIFASRHGDTHRTFKLLSSIADQEPLSPTAFSLSVHNASSGIFSISQGLLANALAIAAGKETLSHAFIEANNLLEQGHASVLLVMTEQPLAEFYQPDSDEIERPYAFAMVLSKTQGQAIDIQFQAQEASSTTALTASLGLQFLHFWHANSPAFDYQGQRLRWHIRRT